MDTSRRQIADLTDEIESFVAGQGDGLFVSPSLTVPVRGGWVLLGTWQRVVLVDFNQDNPQRRVRLSFVAG